MIKSNKLYSWFRKIAFIEGISFLVLLGIAMPLKYWYGMPKAVSIVGGLHGGLFVAFVFLAWEVTNRYNKSWGWLIKAFVSSLIPFGTFILDREWKKEEAAVAN